MDDLQREIGRHPKAYRFDSLRVASPCTMRWADMTGDERVRHCDSCDRQVFNLSEMTREQAEAVLAARGVAPCVRFYRRSDGTIMTADCPTGARRSRHLAVVAAGTALLGSSPALADEPPPEPTASTAVDDTPATDATDTPTAETPTTDTPSAETEETPAKKRSTDEGWVMGAMVCDPPPKHSIVEWSTWLRAGYGVASHAPTFAERATMPEMLPSAQVGEGALGADVSLSIAGNGMIRLGGWAEMRTTSEPVFGGELIATVPRRSYGNRWSGGLVLRAGGNGRVVTGALGFGATRLDPWPSVARHTTSVRMVTSMTRSTDDPRDWSLSLGVELDPVGALGYLLNLGSDD